MTSGPRPRVDLVSWPEEAIALLEAGGLEELSLDHDLGDDCARDRVRRPAVGSRRRGRPGASLSPRLRVHSANVSARLKMEAAIAAIVRLAASA